MNGSNAGRISTASCNSFVRAEIGRAGSRVDTLEYVDTGVLGTEGDCQRNARREMVAQEGDRLRLRPSTSLTSL